MLLGVVVSSSVAVVDSDNNRPLGITSIATIPTINAAQSSSSSSSSSSNSSFCLATGLQNGSILAWSHPSAAASAGSAIVPPVSFGSHSGPVSSITSYLWSCTDSVIDSSSSSSSSSNVLLNNDNNSCNNSPTRSIGSKVVSRLRTQYTTRMGIVSGSNDKISIYDARSLANIRDIDVSILRQPYRYNNYASSVDTGFSNSEDKECFVNSISADSKFKKIVVALSTAQIVELSLDSLAVHQISIGETRVVKGFVCHPTISDVIATCTSDNQVNVWNTTTERIIGQLPVQPGGRITAIEFGSSDIILVATIGGADGSSSSSVASISVVACNFMQPCGFGSSNDAVAMSVVEVVQSIGHGALSSIRMSNDKSKVSVCSEDGNVYLLRANELTAFASPPFLTLYGALTRYGSHVPVSSDFSKCGSFVRSFSACKGGDRLVHVDFFDISGVEAACAAQLANAIAEAEAETEAPDAGPDGSSSSVALLLPTAASINISSYATHVGKRLSSADEIAYVKANIEWSSASSPAAPELRGIYIPACRTNNNNNNNNNNNYDNSNKEADAGSASGWSAAPTQGLQPLELISHSVSSDNALIAASYSDGIIRLFNYLPADNTDSSNDNSNNDNDSNNNGSTVQRQQHLIDIKCHLRGDVLVGFSKTDSRTLVTYGMVDGVFMSWKLKTDN